MHRNYRRKQGKRSRRNTKKGWPRPYSLAEWRTEFWRWARSQVRQELVHERYEMIQSHYPKCDLWEYW
jgi:hypothetical protein